MKILLPLRNLLKKDAKFKWGDEEDRTYKMLLGKMNDPATLHAYVTGKNTHVVADSSEHGLQGSIYKERGKGESTVWVPIDHTSRALTPTEHNYSPIERESLALSWTMEQFRFYTVGAPFTAWTDHQCCH